MPTTCEIDFDDNPMKVVSAGQLIRGTVQLNLTETKIVSGVYIQIYGSAFVRWIDTKSEHPKEYKGSEDYLNERTYFVGAPGPVGTLRLNPGVHNYTFQCMLPPELPTSVEGLYGYIRYIVRVVLDFRLHPETKFEEPFTVIKMINLNASPVLRKPVVVEKHKRIFPCCLCCLCSSDFMYIIARTPVGGYTPGQTIHLEISVTNQSDQLVAEFSVQLIKLITYLTHGNSASRKFERIPIIEHDTHGCGDNQDEIIRVNIEVPPIPPTDFLSSNIIKVKYMILITGSLGCCHSDPVLEIPIMIGSHPIEDSYPFSIAVNAVNVPETSYIPSTTVITQQPWTSRLPDPNHNSSDLQEPAMASTSTQLPIDDQPPTYEEAMSLNETSDNQFRPKYPVFKRSTSYSNGG